MLLSDKPTFTFVPSNPWVAVHWRKPEEITVDLAPVTLQHSQPAGCASI
jgi:sulfide:quinone oxidoreductase